MKHLKRIHWIDLISSYKFIIIFLIVLSLGEFVFFQWFYQDMTFLNRCYKTSHCEDTQRLMDIYHKTMKKSSFSKDIRMPYCLFKVLLQSNRKSEALKVLESIALAHPHNRMLVFELAIELFNLERYPESEKYFRSLLETMAKHNTKGEA